MPAMLLADPKVETPSLILKLVKSCKGSILDQQELELDSSASYLEESDQALSDGKALDHNPSSIQADLSETPGHAVEYLETASAASDDSHGTSMDEIPDIGPDIDERRDIEPPAYVLTWFGLNRIDYHLYLAHNERGINDHLRRNSMLLFDGEECRPCLYDQLSDLRTYFPNGVGQDRDPIMLFNCLPVIRNPASPAIEAYILGFDFDTGNLFVRQFGWFPDYIDDVWCVWNEGFNRYEVQIKALHDTLRQCVDDCQLDPGVGILSKGKYAVGSWEIAEASEDPGMELVIVISFCLWILDMTEPLIRRHVSRTENLIQDFKRYEKECRGILACASARFWEHVRKGYTEQQERCEKTKNRNIDHLMALCMPTNDDTKEDKGRAPDLDIAKRLRRQYEGRRKECREQSLQDVFIRPKKGTTPMSPSATFREIVERSKLALSSSMLPSPKTPRATSPPPSGTQPQNDWIPTYPGILSSSTEESNFLEATESHEDPVPVLLRRMSDLWQAHPELDNFSIRGQLGTILTEMKHSMV
ncbi:hypothetical protein BO94DRAFT_547779 [Aspergillus sclerotioniger CBS 115572]|uniref:Uncharacterized protein n=1 Tax=Aspergillus sclerotioniger CBS 115572 TaxID=1450535 RepID=A0A317WD75_9EURO|nr:hypothetical protein BO94DRAFT_547779 [Aspergillus sclerotioniger CBS 115572]PWY83307.1 hypothetical protein BO94DRAFT_547779 [Aspergillus sclerotioniger CBS 115572]